MGFDYPFAMLPYDERWKERRRLFVQHFRPSDMSIIYPQAREFAQRFLVELSQAPEHFHDIARGYVFPAHPFHTRLIPFDLQHDGGIHHLTGLWLPNQSSGRSPPRVL